MGFANVEIVCTACGEESLLKREPVYEGFKKTGEALSCSACGHPYADESEVPFKEKKRLSIFADDDVPQKVNIFGDDDRSEKIDVFADEERQKNCRHCEHYVVNPFTQRCGLHDREVQATDFCPDFKKEEKDGGA